MVANDSKNFTVENNIYKGKVSSYITNYKSFGEIIWTKIKSYGDKIIYLDGRTGNVVTYAELQDKVVRCALWLQKQGIKSGDVVSLCTNNHLNSIVPCLAAVYINAIFNPWHENIDLQTALHFMKLTTPKVIFCTEKPVNVILSTIKKINCNPTIVVFGNHPDAISFSDILNMYSDAEVANFRYVDVDDIKQTACIMHSSGTTGMPKGVEISNYSLLCANEKIGLDINNKVSMWFSSLYWISGLQLNLKSIVHGSKVIIYPEFDEEMMCQLIEKYKVRVVSKSYIQSYF